MTLKFNELQQRLKEAKEKKVVFSFGRMNPPTIGHEKLVNKIKSEAKTRGADARLYLSHTSNKEKDPLTYNEKAKYAKKAFDIFKKSRARTIIEVAKELEAEGYTDITLVFGEDRDAEMVNLIKKYNGKDFTFNSIDSVSAGKRNPNAKGVEGISGTKLRELAKTGKLDMFKQALASKLSDREKTAIYNQIRKVYSISDDVIFDRDELREAYLMGEFFNVGDIVYDMNENKEYEIIEQGPNFVYCQGEDGNVYTKWLSDLSEKKQKDDEDRSSVRQDKDIGDKSGTQPAKYYKGLKSKSTKSARDAHFKKGAKKSDDDPSAYEPAPGDATAKTKPSQHTKKFKQMFGEDAAVRDAARSTSKVSAKVSIDPEMHDYPGNSEIPPGPGGDDDPHGGWIPGDPTPDMAITGIDGKNAKQVLDKAKTEIDKERKRPTPVLGFKDSIKEQWVVDEQKLVEQAEVAFEVTIDGVGTMLVAGKNKQEVKQRLQKMFRDARKFTIGKRLMDPQIKMWYRAQAGDKTQVDESRITHDEEDELRIEWNIDEFLEEEVDVDNDEEIEKFINDVIDGYDELEDVEDIYPDLDGDGDHDDEDWSNMSSDDGMQRTVIDDNYEWVDEVLTPAQRFKRSQQMRRLKGKIARARKIALRRPSSPEKLQKRAQRHARNLLRKRYIKGKNYNDLSFAEKQAIEKRLQGKSALITRLAMRLRPKLKKLEQERLRNMNKQESRLIEANLYRVGSEMYYETFNDWKKSINRSQLDSFDRELLESDIGSFAMYEGNHVPLDCPMIEEEKQPELNKPKAGGPKKYYVYVKDPKSGNIKKVSWGDTTGLKIKLNDPEARKSFAARHQCSTKKDKTKPGYWACRMPYYAKQLGLSGGGNFFW